MARFYSQEWVKQWQDKCNSDADYLKKTKGFTAKMLWIVHDCPDGNDVKLLAEFEAGKMVKADYSMKKAPSDFRTEPWDQSISLTRIQASYPTYAKLNKKEISPMGAMGAKLYKIEGDMIKLMAQMGNLTACADLMATIPCEY